MARTYDVDLSKGLNYMWLFPQFPWQRNEFLVLAEAEISMSSEFPQLDGNPYTTP